MQASIGEQALIHDHHPADEMGVDFSSRESLGDHTTAILLGRIRCGDAAARGDLVARLEPLLRRFARGRVPQMLRHEHDTADLVQLTWLRVLGRLDEFVPTHAGSLFAYLRQTLVSAMRDALRNPHHQMIQQAGPATMEEIEGLPAPGAEPADWLSYEQSMAKLEPELRALVLMRFEFGMSFAEIGAEFGESADTVRMRMVRALRDMADDV
jgi:RNA polymerase sigma factor (sigma-70 family)